MDDKINEKSSNDSKEVKEHYAQIIGFASGKGGVGKTSIALNVANLCANSGLKVLFIDCDVNTNGATTFFLTSKNQKMADELNNALCFKDFLNKMINNSKLKNKEHKLPEIVTVSDNFDFIPGSVSETHFGENEIYKIKTDLEENLEKGFGVWKRQYDLIILDFIGGCTTTTEILARIADSICIVMEPTANSRNAVKGELSFLITPKSFKRISVCYNRLQKDSFVSQYSIIDEFNGFLNSNRYANLFGNGEFIDLIDEDLMVQLVNIIENICFNKKAAVNYRKKMREAKEIIERRHLAEIKNKHKIVLLTLILVCSLAGAATYYLFRAMVFEHQIFGGLEILIGVLLMFFIVLLIDTFKKGYLTQAIIDFMRNNNDI